MRSLNCLTLNKKKRYIQIAIYPNGHDIISVASLRGNFSARFAVDHVRVRPFAISRLTGYHAGGKSDWAPRSVLIIRKLFRGRHVGSGRIGRSELVAQLYNDRDNIELACSIGCVSQRQLRIPRVERCK